MRRIFFVTALLVSGILLGATGDVIYRVTERRWITPQQAICFATCARNANGWSGTNVDMQSVCVHRVPRNDAITFELIVEGLKRASLSTALRSGPVNVEGIEE